MGARTRAIIAACVVVGIIASAAAVVAQTAYTYNKITISSTALALGAAGVAITDTTTRLATITVEDAQIRWRYDGSDPTSANGHLANIGEVIQVAGNTNVKQFRAIRVSATDATIHVSLAR